MIMVWCDIEAPLPLLMYLATFFSLTITITYIGVVIFILVILVLFQIGIVIFMCQALLNAQVKPS